MTAPAPTAKLGEEVNLTVAIEGTPLDSESIVSVETWSEANRIPRARIVLFDGEPDTQRFPSSESDTFVPGKKVTIAAGYGSGSKTVHSGVVIRHSLRIAPGAPAQLVVETADPLIKMTLRRNSALTAGKSDTDIIKALLSANGGSLGKNGAGAAPIETMIQYHSFDWDLLLLRAEANGCVVAVEDSKADLISPTAAGSPVLTLEYGDSIVSLEATIDATAPVGDQSVKSRSWSYKQQKLASAAGASAAVTAPGDLDAAKLAGVFSLAAVPQQTAAYVPDGQLAGWSSAALMRAKLAAVQGTAQFQGSAEVKPGSFVSLKGLGERFNGDAFVSSVRHDFRDGDWQTMVGFGMAPDSFASRAEGIAAPPAGGLVPPVRGLHVGQVKGVANDPAGEFRVLVTLPLVEGAEGVWARLGQFYASAGFGAAFYPEVGDEVVLGFMDEDPSNPVILGSVYSSQRAPTHAPVEANDCKSLVTRSKIEISFDDKDIVFQIQTPGKRVIRLDDKEKKITISDSFGNHVTMAEDKVDIVSGAALNLSSATDMTIKSGANLKVTATGTYSVSGAKIQESATGTLSLSSTGPGELKSAAPLTIKGALVQIN
ncbi:MAG: hypothetical protein QOG72_1742 [Sphingomonadales bacterium]|jgi:Rhs element Vgr protein|nr:hypothetical protein [Sphingomonadales bacterium]